ncbi:hypothetical protein L249_7364 [Ophiocordyceps polyrhachis-furcata BCC 54312]|uniref:protein-histidine N-methyltransferase n=1 Tax=Ophiocordyceps polyrhachis-furcata BCC 54312 TaxID=1330021 RepID=A0A367LA99_9HYPO|nr:hypothetical protein L249_7364 [Ophiocordyceps polyrhachis-furcata BCC 54312]
MAFSFAFSGDDIDAQSASSPPGTASATQPPAAGAFPVAGYPQLPPKSHDLDELLSRLPSKLAYSCLEVLLDDGSTFRIPRRELWDVRLQLMAEDDNLDRTDHGLDHHDVKTGVYEGGFKSWESSLDLVKVLATQRVLSSSWQGRPSRIIELGCGTALPSLALFLWALEQEPSSAEPVTFFLADYNPTVLQLVTVPNLLLTWALYSQYRHPALHQAFSLENELEVGPEVLQAFEADLSRRGVTLFFLSGAWSPGFVQLFYQLQSVIPSTCALPPVTLILGAETIYSPLALRAFTETILAILEREGKEIGTVAGAFVAAKKLYFGVGGSLSDFVVDMESRGARVMVLREETEGVRRGVLHCTLPS